jgi:hypothetical protein
VTVGLVEDLSMEQSRGEAATLNASKAMGENPAMTAHEKKESKTFAELVLGLPG